MIGDISLIRLGAFLVSYIQTEPLCHIFHSTKAITGKYC